MKTRSAVCLLIAAGAGIFAGAHAAEPLDPAAAPLQPAAAPLQPEVSTVETLGSPSPHWLLVNDSNFLGYMDSKVLLMDTDTGRMLGQMATGGWRNAVEIAPDFTVIYSPETYYPRVTRGDREEVITVYETTGLTAIDEVLIPPKRATGAPLRGYSGMSDDGRFVYVANMTPAMSVTVADMQRREYVGEIPTAGCMIILPTGNRSFAMICGDGSAMHITLNDAGDVIDKSKTAPFFDAQADPVTEKTARIGNTWYLVSFNGLVHPLMQEGGTLSAGTSWTLLSEAEHAAGWRPGGQQFVAAHEASGRLFVIVNQGGDHSHKHGGKTIWVYDVATQKRIGELALPAEADRVAVSHDADPVLVIGSDGPAMFVLDPDSGAVLRGMEGPILGPGVMQFPKL